MGHLMPQETPRSRSPASSAAWPSAPLPSCKAPPAPAPWRCRRPAVAPRRCWRRWRRRARAHGETEWWRSRPAETRGGIGKGLMYTKDGETVRNKLPFDEVDKSVGRWVNINQLRNNLLLGRAVFWGKLVFLLCSFWESLGSDSKDGFRGIWGQGLKWPSWTIRLKLTSWLWFWCYIWDICLDYVHILYIMMYIYIYMGWIGCTVI